MKRTLAATPWIVACAFVVGLTAQAAQPPTNPQTPQAQKADDDKAVTLTGCLAAGEEPNTFKLTNIGAADKPAVQPGQMVGTTGIKAGEAVQLIGADAAKLKNHVGHTVSVTGMLVPRKEGQAATPATPPATAGKEKAEMRLNFKSFKHVDATCPPAGK